MYRATHKTCYKRCMSYIVVNFYFSFKLYTVIVMNNLIISLAVIDGSDNSSIKRLNIIYRTCYVYNTSYIVFTIDYTQYLLYSIHYTVYNIVLQNEEVCGNTIYSSSEASGVNHIIHRSRKLR